MRLALSTLLVKDYDEAIDYFCNILGFALLEDSQLSPEKRWVVIGTTGASLLLAKASNGEQKSQIGKAAGGRVAHFLYTKNFDQCFQNWQSKGVNFLEAPRQEPYGKVVQFADLYGNKWDLIGSESPPDLHRH